MQVYHVMLVQDMDSKQELLPPLDKIQQQLYHVMRVQKELKLVHNHLLMQLNIQLMNVNLDII